VELEAIVAWVGVGCYAAAATLAVVALLHHARRGARLSVALMGAGGVSLLVVVAQRIIGAGVVPTFTRFEAFSCYAIAVTAAYLILLAVRPLHGVTSLVASYLTAVLACGLPTVGLRAGPPPPFQSAWVALHLLAGYAAYAVFSLGSILAAAYLVQDHNLKRKHFGAVWERLPSLEALDHLMSRLMGLAFLLLSVSIILGFVLVRQSGGSEQWLIDPKVAATLATWILFAVLVHMRASADRHGRGVALVTVAGLACLLFAFVGVHLIADSVHAFLQIRVGLTGP